MTDTVNARLADALHDKPIHIEQADEEDMDEFEDYCNRWTNCDGTSDYDYVDELDGDDDWNDC